MSDEMELSKELEPPMANGELLFESPWQSRVFGMARVLCEADYFLWDDFRDALIQQISAWDQAHRIDEPYVYYDHFLAALTSLLGEKGIMGASELLEKDLEFQNRPHGHDH
jgi:nitrile hydratase accessory protein